MSDSNPALRRSERTKKPAATPNPTESVLKEKSNTKLNESPLDEVSKNPSASKRKKRDEQSDDENVGEASVSKKIQKNPPVKEKKAVAQKANPKEKEPIKDAKEEKMSENLASESEATSSKKGTNKSDEHNKITKSILLESATISIEHCKS